MFLTKSADLAYLPGPQKTPSFANLALTIRWQIRNVSAGLSSSSGDSDCASTWCRLSFNVSVGTRRGLFFDVGGGEGVWGLIWKHWTRRAIHWILQLLCARLAFQRASLLIWPVLYQLHSKLLQRALCLKWQSDNTFLFSHIPLYTSIQEPHAAVAVAVLELKTSIYIYIWFLCVVWWVG